MARMASHAIGAALKMERLLQLTQTLINTEKQKDVKLMTIIPLTYVIDAIGSMITSG